MRSCDWMISDQSERDIRRTLTVQLVSELLLLGDGSRRIQRGDEVGQRLDAGQAFVEGAFERYQGHCSDRTSGVLIKPSWLSTFLCEPVELLIIRDYSFMRSCDWMISDQSERDIRRTLTVQLVSELLLLGDGSRRIQRGDEVGHRLDAGQAFVEG
ncbi:hypothetical protein TNIN_277011 [Trichonephila inaurata madagascariensis]|uniref:Uncharacterized protein n=1 Tax=Trichonephila inaurata madagascariensis TaxID=2747483 RepID=A0A8X6WLP9_9ARAC|nr:hypothetical protein TNIN_277011 [Trichonephila inaurata madagascariensis]